MKDISVDMSISGLDENIQKDKHQIRTTQFSRNDLNFVNDRIKNQLLLEEIYSDAYKKQAEMGYSKAYFSIKKDENIRFIYESDSASNFKNNRQCIRNNYDNSQLDNYNVGQISPLQFNRVTQVSQLSIQKCKFYELALSEKMKNGLEFSVEALYQQAVKNNVNVGMYSQYIKSVLAGGK